MMLISSVNVLFGLQIVVVKHLQYCFPIFNNWQSGMITTLVSFCFSILFLTPVSKPWHLIYIAERLGHFAREYFTTGHFILFYLFYYYF